MSSSAGKARSYRWGTHNQYSLGLSGELIENYGNGAPPQIHNVPRFLSEEVVRLGEIENQHRDLVSFADHILTALGIDGEQDNAGNIALDRIRELVSDRDRIRTELLEEFGEPGPIEWRYLMTVIDRVCPKER